MKKRQKTLFRLLQFVFPLIILSVAITGVVLSRNSYENLWKTIDQDYHNIINLATSQIATYVEDARTDLDARGQVLSAAKLDPWRQELIVRAFNQGASHFLSISFLSEAGHEIVSAGWREAATVLNEDEMIKGVLRGESRVSDVMFTRENIPFVCMAVPVYRRGQVIGILWSELNLKSVWNVVKEINIGRTGQVYIVDLEGRLIGDRNIADVIRPVASTWPEVIARLREQGHPAISWTDISDGVKYCIETFGGRG
jgi:hypothetical protein